MTHARARTRGFTLTEVTVVIVLAAVVMTGLSVFYFNSQATWIDGSSQAITQREATLVLHEIANRSRGAAWALAAGNPNATLTLGPGNPVTDPRRWVFAWAAGDSLLHESYVDSAGTTHDLGAMLQSRVATFAVVADSGTVRVDSLVLFTPQGTRIVLGANTTMINRGAS